MSIEKNKYCSKWTLFSFPTEDTRSCSFHRFRYVSKKIFLLNIKYPKCFSLSFWTMMLFYSEILEYLNEKRATTLNFQFSSSSSGRNCLTNSQTFQNLSKMFKSFEKDLKISWENWKLQHVEGSLPNFSELFHYHWQFVLRKKLLKFSNTISFSSFHVHESSRRQLSIHRLWKSWTRKFDFRLTKKRRKISIHRVYF